VRRTNHSGDRGLCGMLINPMYGTGGFILDEKGRFIDPSTAPHYPQFVTNWVHWVQDNWRVRTVDMFATAVICMHVGVVLFVPGLREAGAAGNGTEV
jgi:hypothetical protein